MSCIVFDYDKLQQSSRLRLVICLCFGLIFRNSLWTDCSGSQIACTQGGGDGLLIEEWEQIGAFPSPADQDVTTPLFVKA